MRVYEGDLFDQVNQAEIFVLNHIDTTIGTRTDSVQAPTTYEIPPRAIREVIVNAVAHRDYASTASVEVRVFSDRVEVWNPGELPPGKMVAGLPQTTVDVRNRTIVHAIWRKTTKETGKTSKKTTKENEATSKKTSKKTIVIKRVDNQEGWTILYMFYCICLTASRQ